jgi:hypothetical protein
VLCLLRVQSGMQRECGRRVGSFHLHDSDMHVRTETGEWDSLRGEVALPSGLATTQRPTSDRPSWPFRVGAVVPVVVVAAVRMNDNVDSAAVYSAVRTVKWEREKERVNHAFIAMWTPPPVCGVGPQRQKGFDVVVVQRA